MQVAARDEVREARELWGEGEAFLASVTHWLLGAGPARGEWGHALLSRPELWFSLNPVL